MAVDKNFTKKSGTINYSKINKMDIEKLIGILSHLNEDEVKEMLKIVEADLNSVKDAVTILGLGTAGFGTVATALYVESINKGFKDERDLAIFTAVIAGTILIFAGINTQQLLAISKFHKILSNYISDTYPQLFSEEEFEKSDDLESRIK